MVKPVPRTVRVPPMTDAMYGTAIKPGKKDEPTDVVSARYNRPSDTLDLGLRNGIQVRFPRAHIRELAAWLPKEIGRVDIQPGGDGISIRNLDVDISVPGLLADELGALFARAIGRRARGKTSEKKAASSRANGSQQKHRRAPSAA